MKLSKKLASMVVAASIVLGTSVTAFAAPNDDVISALKNAKVPATYLIQAENYLKNNTLTADQASAVTSKINDAASVLKTAGVTDITKLSAAQKQQVIADATSAGSAIGLTVTTAKQSNGTYAVVAKDASGNTVANFTSNDVKQTGSNDIALALGAVLLVAAAGSTAFAVKKVRA